MLFYSLSLICPIVAVFPDDLVTVLDALSLTKAEKDGFVRGRLLDLGRMLCSNKPEAIYTVLGQQHTPPITGPALKGDMIKKICDRKDMYEVNFTRSCFLVPFFFSSSFFFPPLLSYTHVHFSLGHSLTTRVCPR